MQPPPENLKYFTGYNSTQPLKHVLFETNLTVTPSIQHSPPQLRQDPLSIHDENRVPHLLTQPSSECGHMMSPLSQSITDCLAATLGISPHQSTRASNPVQNLYARMLEWTLENCHPRTLDELGKSMQERGMFFRHNDLTTELFTTKSVLQGYCQDAWLSNRT
ncbi:uncharacterized protein LOC111086221 [Limulus polyphemus]|uniref:Uncharacterized protein LOC111086221 n=1 Tax=Limulus polyphemus TaxID=6850 RepID=A0ABM1SJS9_LIMPO|nr:uncharacterized protein LOC111086221 [Limulus polyphemus]